MNGASRHRSAPRRPRARAAALLAAAGVLAGCASVPPEAGFGELHDAARQHLRADLAWARDGAALAAIEARVAELLRAPLSADTAVQVALLNHRGLQARYQDLGIAAADLLQATRLPNPGFSFGRMTQGEEIELERGLHVNLARLLMAPTVSRLEATRLQALRREITAEVLAHAAQTRKAWIQAVAAEQGVHYARQVREAAQASAELARRMEQVGNFNKLARAREQGFLAEAALGLARAEAVQRATRERLVRQLGLWGEQTAFRLPERLPDLPPEPADQPDIERAALAQRLDVQAARLTVEHTARQLGLTRQTRLVNVFEFGYGYNTSNEGPVQKGWEIEFQLPLFDWGGARVQRAEAVYMQAVHRAARTAIDARSEVREAYHAWRTAWDIARHHRDELVPLRQRIADEQLLRYNGMLIGVFELLADARLQIGAVNAAIEAQRDFWLAQADLDMALLGKPALALPAGPAAPAGAAADPH